MQPHNKDLDAVIGTVAIIIIPNDKHLRVNTKPKPYAWLQDKQIAQPNAWPKPWIVPQCDNAMSMCSFLLTCKSWQSIVFNFAASGLCLS